MAFVYNGEHSITFIETNDSYKSGMPLFYKTIINTWTNMHAVPLSRPSIGLSQPDYRMIQIPGTNDRLDITDLSPNGLKFGPRSGSWEFAIDHDLWPNWYTAKDYVESNLNGKRRYCILDDDPNTAYCGRFTIKDWRSEDKYMSFTIDYTVEHYYYLKDGYELIASNNLISSWDEVRNSLDGHSYREKFRVGNVIPLSFSDYNGYAQIAGIDTDEDYNDNNISITWILKNVMNTTKQMNSSSNSNGWPSSELRLYVSRLKGSMPVALVNLIKPAKKYTKTYSNSLAVSYDDVWIPSYREVFYTYNSSSDSEQNGAHYDGVFNTAYLRKRSQISSSTYRSYWLRTAYTNYSSYTWYVDSYGSAGATSDTSSRYLLIGFCT